MRDVCRGSQACVIAPLPGCIMVFHLRITGACVCTARCSIHPNGPIAPATGGTPGARRFRISNWPIRASAYYLRLYEPLARRPNYRFAMECRALLVCCINGLTCLCLAPWLAIGSGIEMESRSMPAASDCVVGFILLLACARCSL